MSTRTESVAEPTVASLDLGAIGAPALPQVNLLPPEIRSRRALGRVKVRLGIALLCVVLLAAVGFVYALKSEADTARVLEQKRADVLQLQSDQAKYAEVPRIKKEIASTVEARDAAMSTEVLWVDYVQAIQAVTPPEVRIFEMSTLMPGPLTPETTSSSPLDGPSIGSVSFTGTAEVLPDLATWIDALNQVPGLQDATYTTAELRDEEAVVAYTIAVTVQVTSDAYSGRFTESEDE